MGVYGACLSLGSAAHRHSFIGRPMLQWCVPRAARAQPLWRQWSAGGLLLALALALVGARALWARQQARDGRKQCKVH